MFSVRVSTLHEHTLVVSSSTTHHNVCYSRCNHLCVCRWYIGLDILCKHTDPPVCVCEGEREREGEKKREGRREGDGERDSKCVLETNYADSNLRGPHFQPHFHLVLFPNEKLIMAVIADYDSNTMICVDPTLSTLIIIHNLLYACHYECENTICS